MDAVVRERWVLHWQNRTRGTASPRRVPSKRRMRVLSGSGADEESRPSQSTASRSSSPLVAGASAASMSGGPKSPRVSSSGFVMSIDSGSGGRASAGSTVRQRPRPLWRIGSAGSAKLMLDAMDGVPHDALVSPGSTGSFSRRFFRSGSSSRGMYTAHVHRLY